MGQLIPETIYVKSVAINIIWERKVGEKMEVQVTELFSEIKS